MNATVDSAAEYVPIERLRPWENNPRKNDGAPVEKVAASITQFGFANPILARLANGEIIAGHTRYKAAIHLGMSRVPVRFLDLTEDQAHLLALADNRIAEEAKWDDALLAAVLIDLRAKDVPLSGSAFSDSELSKLLSEKTSDEPAEDWTVPKVAVTRPGDIWQLGESRLLCGDATKPEDIARLTEGKPVHLLWTDPPYNVAYVGKTKNALVIQNDAMTDTAFLAFLTAAFQACSAQMRPGAGFYIAHADVEGFNFYSAVRAAGWKFSQCIIWVKDRFVMGRKDYHSRHEPIMHGWKEGAAHHAVTDRTQDTIWEFDRPHSSLEHPTMKPTALIERAIVNSTNRGETVLDSFGGSGSTALAALRQERRSMLCEIDPLYCDVIVDRWQQLSGEKATR